MKLPNATFSHRWLIVHLNGGGAVNIPTRREDDDKWDREITTAIFEDYMFVTLADENGSDRVSIITSQIAAWRFVWGAEPGATSPHEEAAKEAARALKQLSKPDDGEKWKDA